MNRKIPKDSLVIAGHLHWLSMKLPETYATRWTTFDSSQRSCVWDWTFVSGSLSVSYFMNALFDSSLEAWVCMPEQQNLLVFINNKYGLLGSSS